MKEILVVEDSATDMAMMQALLQRDGFHVSTATNGREAIQQMQRHLPDVVVTDLQMPVMDGEALVRHVFQHFPTVPVILATAHGSEILAVNALAGGAVNFIPKVSASSLLPRVVQQTIQLANADQTFRESLCQLQKPEFYFKLKTRIAAIEPVIGFLGQVLSASASMTPTTRMRTGTAVASAILNAICYGNLELTDEDESLRAFLVDNQRDEIAFMKQFEGSSKLDRVVKLKVSVGSRDTRISVSHEGHGRLIRMTPAPGTPASFELEQCRGWLLITSFMDDVILNTDRTEVVMVKHHDVS